MSNPISAVPDCSRDLPENHKIRITSQIDQYRNTIETPSTADNYKAKVINESSSNKPLNSEYGVATLQQGNYLIREVHVSQAIADNNGWGCEGEPPNSAWDELIGKNDIQNVPQIYHSEGQNARNSTKSPL